MNELNNKICYIVNIVEETDGNYSYTIGQYQTDGIISGQITKTKKIENNKYEIDVFSKGCTGDECMDEREDKTYNFKIDITNINNNKIIIDENEYTFITDIEKFINEENEVTENNQTTKENNYDTKVYDELTKISKLDYNFIKNEYTTDYSVGLSIDGKININFENNISNISNAKDIVLFSSPTPYPTLYIVTTNGDVYKYDFSNYELKNYNATKINEYSNIEKIITYRTRKKNAGGCDYVIGVDKDNKYYKLDSFCV